MKETKKIDEYKNRMKSNKLNGSSSDILREAWEVALDTRKFEIELYWKRSAYFILFIGAIFVGYYQMKDDSLFLQYSLVALGYISSVIWHCANRGSKFWQENWEMHIFFLGKTTHPPMFTEILRNNKSPWALLKEYPYSVSKLNTLLSLIISLSWVVLTSNIAYNHHGNLPCEWVGVITILLCAVAIFFTIHKVSSGFAAKYTKKCEHLKVKDDEEETANKQEKDKNKELENYPFFNYEDWLN